ncbi:ABC transporter substrate-binding protein [Microbacterium gorillae]|uniref:ABC transporter substrate-binding protein n=1 Tax=Microbacterium gorillae TaxID=1231063 RepID=UPI00058D37E6|nr:sugar ABC transporter substrate-binding protein [Microbacterium gorillae]
MKYKALAAGALTLAVALATAGCSSGSGSSSSSGGAGGGDVTLTFSIWNDLQQPAMQKIADAFHAENPNVTVQIQLTPWDNYWNKLQTTVAAGSGPDVIWFTGQYFGLYASEGQLAPIEGVDLSKFPKESVSMYEYDGKQYAVPKDFDTVALWYNKKLFADAGLPVPGKGYTWEQMQKDAKTLTKGDVKGFAASSAAQQNWYPAIYSAGGTIIDDKGNAAYNSPEAKEGVSFLKSFIDDGSSPTLQQMTDTPPSDAFGSGKIAMLWTQNTNARTMAMSAAAKDIDVAPVPAGPAGSITVLNSIGLGVNAKSQHLEEAQKFVAFATGPEGAKIQAEAGNAIPSYEGTQAEWLKSYPQFDLQVFLDAAKTAKGYPQSVAMSKWVDSETTQRTAIWSGKESVSDGLDKLNSEVQAAIDATKKK